ncbi:hypothetical protein EBU71_01720 [bacterium]|nr:hypothetical protein [Candidatus Elulimicrobium humile]
MSDDNNTIDITKIQEQQRRIEHEQNVLLQPLWRSVMNLKTPRQAISCASAMIVAGKDLLVLELGADVAKNFIDNLNYNTLDLVTSKQVEIQNELDKIAKEAISPTVVKADFTKKKEKEKENDKQ